MKITKRQLRGLIKEELGSSWHAGIADDPQSEWDILLTQLSNAGDLAARIHSVASDSEHWKGTESHDLADLLEQIWVKAGFDPGAIFK